MRRGGAALAVVAVLLAGCSTSGHGASAPTASSPAPSTSPAPTTAAAPTTATVTAPSSTAPLTSAPPDSSPATTTTAAPAHTTCTSIGVRVITGSASLGQEFAALQFINTGVKTCVLAGYPTATLYRNGTQIGQSSQPSSIAPSVRTLHPGDVAESQLHDYTDCQAPLSDSVRVQIPGLATTVERPTQLRGCILRVDRLGAPD